MPAEFEALARKIKAQGSAKNPFAVARSVLGSDKDILHRRKRKRSKKNGPFPRDIGKR